MLTAYELGCLTVKKASWLSEGVRSWFTPRPQPQEGVRSWFTPRPQPQQFSPKDQLPANQFGKSLKEPLAPNKGLPKGYEPERAQPQYDYFNPPTGDVKTTVTPYDYMKPLYKNYPGGYQQAINDAQRWQEHASLEGLTTWKPEDLHQPVNIITGGYVKPWEARQARSWGFTLPGGHQTRTIAYQTRNLGTNFPPDRKAIVTNPNDRRNNDAVRSTYGHEFTHAVDSGNTNGENVFKGHEQNFPAYHGLVDPDTGDTRSRLDYVGTPTEFGAFLSEIRRHWIENNPGKRLSTVADADNLLKTYTPWVDHRGEPEYRQTTGSFPFFNVKTIPRPAGQIQDALPQIMANPELKRKAILQILSSVVQNRRPQPPTIA